MIEDVGYTLDPAHPQSQVSNQLNLVEEAISRLEHLYTAIEHRLGTVLKESASTDTIDEKEKPEQELVSLAAQLRSFHTSINRVHANLSELINARIEL